MFDDPKEELRRLESRLLEEEEREEPEETDSGEDWLAEAHRLLGEDAGADDEEAPGSIRVHGEPAVRNFANGYGRVRNTDRADLDMEEYSDQIYDAPREKGLRGLIILACLETLGIVAVMAYWFLVLL